MTLLLSACVKNEELVPGGHISAVMESEQTKTSVTDEGSFTWSAGDKVWIGTTSGGVVGTLSDGAGTSKAEFTYGTFFGEMTGNAVYPYNSGHKVKGNELSVVLPASYDLGASLSNTNAVMYGVNVGGTFQFSHLAGVMRFKFKNVPAGTDRFQITLDKKVNGTFVVDLASDQPVVESVASSEDADRTITMNFAPLQSASDIALYIPLPVGTYTSLSLDLWAGEQSVWTYSNTVTNTISRKTLKLMPTITLGGTVGGDIVGGDSEDLNDVVNKLNCNIQAIQTILIAVQQNDNVTEVMKIMENSVEIGYSLTFAKGATVTIYHNLDGSMPQIGVKKETDGEYYWTTGNEWLTDSNGHKLPVTAASSDGSRITPQLRVVDGVWYISCDNGDTWNSAENEEGNYFTCFIASVGYDSSFVYITLNNGSIITIPTNLNGVQTEEVYASSYGVLPGNVNDEDMSRLLSYASANNKTIRFNDGTYLFSSTINIPSNVSIVGNTKTVFAPASEMSPSTLMRIDGSDNVLISHITFDGGLTSKPAQEGSQIGLSVVSCRSVNIENVEFVGWSKQGLYSKNMSSYGEENDGKFFKHLQMTNCRFYFNYCGNYFDYRCEYTQMLNCVWGENYIGTVNCGGNNSYVSCQWNANYTGFQMENDGSNPAHGGCNGCTFNHNDNQAILINDCVNGWTFDGCQIFYGKVVLNNSKGVIFNGNIWGSCRFYSVFPGQKNMNMIANTYFQTERNVILAGNDGSTLVVNCIPEEEKIDNVIEDQEWTCLAYTKSGISSGASNCYFANCSTPVAANSTISSFYVAINSASVKTIVKGVNVWVVNAESDVVFEKIVDNKDLCVSYSSLLQKYVLNIDINRTFDFPVYFIAQSTRTDGVGIAYSTTSSKTEWLVTEAPSIGDIVEPNSNIIAEFAVYSK